MLSLLNSHLERTVIINDITQDNNKDLGYKSNETVKLHRLDRSMEEALSTFQSVVEAKQRNDGTQQKRTLAEKKTPPPGQTRNMIWIYT